MKLTNTASLTRFLKHEVADIKQPHHGKRMFTKQSTKGTMKRKGEKPTQSAESIASNQPPRNQRGLPEESVLCVCLCVRRFQQTWNLPGDACRQVELG